MPYLFTPLSLE